MAKPIAPFGGHRGGGKKRADGLVAGSAEAIEAVRKKDAARKRDARSAQKTTPLPPPLSVMAASPASPVAAVASGFCVIARKVRTEVEHLFNGRFAQFNLRPFLSISGNNLTPIREVAVDLFHNAFPARCGELNPIRIAFVHPHRHLAFTLQESIPLQELLTREVDGLFEVEFEGIGGKQTPAIGADDGVALRFLHSRLFTG